MILIVQHANHLVSISYIFNLSSYFNYSKLHRNLDLSTMNISVTCPSLFFSFCVLYFLLGSGRNHYLKQFSIYATYQEQCIPEKVSIEVTTEGQPVFPRTASHIVCPKNGCYLGSLVQFSFLRSTSNIFISIKVSISLTPTTFLKGHLICVTIMYSICAYRHIPQTHLLALPLFSLPLLTNSESTSDFPFGSFETCFYDERSQFRTSSYTLE